MLIKGYSQVNMENLVKMLKKHVIAVKSEAVAETEQSLAPPDCRYKCLRRL